MGSPKSTALAIAALLASLGAAAAADAAFPPAIEAPDVVPVPVEIGSGWYLRGDIGLAHQKPHLVYGPSPLVDFVHEDAHNTWSAGGGVGYKFNSFFRVDVTADWRHQKFEGALDCARRPCWDAGFNPITSGFTLETASGEFWTGLANAYVDFALVPGITPYVGAGVGAYYASLGPYHSWGPTGVLLTQMPSHDNVRFAAAAMAGVAFDVSDNLKLDAGYRYLWLGHTQASIDHVEWVDFRKLDAHELRVGFRYMLD